MAKTPPETEHQPSHLDQARTLLSILAGAIRRPESRVTLLGAALGIGFLTLIFWSNLRHFVFSWSTDENYSHGFLVPLISLYFANQAAARGPVQVCGGVIPGLVLLCAALMVKLATVVIVVGTFGDLALLAAIAGLC